jgi:hypothetical protein
LKKSGSPRSFYCSSNPGIAYSPLTEGVIAIAALLRAQVKRLDIDFGERRSMAITSQTIRPKQYPTLRLWFVVIRSPTYPVSVVFRDEAGEAVGGVGRYCVKKPEVCKRN